MSTRILVPVSLIAMTYIPFSLACADEPLDVSGSRSESALAYMTDRDWKWHQHIEGVQIWYDETEERLTLRHVNQRDAWSAYVYFDPGYELVAAIIFHTSCEPDQVIDVPPDDKHDFSRELYCLQDGSGYLHTGHWQSKKQRGVFDFVWEDDLSGHDFSINFGNWDFSPLTAEKDQARIRPPQDPY